MFLVQLIYASRAHELDDKTMEDILSVSKKNNASSGITGVLHFSRKYFVQCLEGSRESVNQTYCKILNDDRHKDVMLLMYRVISERSFADWSMIYVGDGKLKSQELLKYSASPEFDPYKISGESAHSLIKELADSIMQNRRADDQ